MCVWESVCVHIRGARVRARLLVRVRERKRGGEGGALTDSRIFSS